MTPVRTALLTFTLGAGLAVSAPAATATDYTALRADPVVHEALVGVSIAYLIEKACPSISRRTIYGLSQMLKLRKYGRELGYSNKEMEKYINSREEQARFRAIVEPYLASRGAVEGNAESYCMVGRAEIAEGTVAGTLMKED